MSSRELVFIDLSSIIHPLWHVSASEPDPNHCSQATVARVHALANGNEHVAVCCDSGRSFRKDLDATYKANRPERDASLHHQTTLATETLRADGFPVWSADGFEADDVIATATRKALEFDDTTVLVVTGDKDLLQLVGPRVQAKSVQDGTVRDSAAVLQKFGVRPDQMRDYLTLVGDSSDNVKGVPGVGPKTAVALLARSQTLDRLYEDLAAVGAQQLDVTPGVAAKLRAFLPDLAKTRALISLRTDVVIPFEEVLRARVSEAEKVFVAETEEPSAQEPDPAQTNGTSAIPDVAAAGGLMKGGTETLAAENRMIVREPDILAPAPVEWERQLDPRSLQDAQRLATDMHHSRMFSSYGSPQAVLSTVLVGRELGLPAMASLRSIHNIEGKHCLSASLMVALILKSGLAEYFEPVSFSVTEATFETHRKGARNPVRLQHTFEMAVQAWPKEKGDWEKRFQASGWGRNPTDMLVARATSRLARMVYPDILSSLYTPEELEELKESHRG